MMAWMNTMDMNVIFDGVLVCSILGLWVMWFRQAGQRKKVEVMLQQAAADLQQASALLDHVMQERVSAQQDGMAERKQHHVSSEAMLKAIQKNIARQDKVDIQYQARHQAQRRIRSQPRKKVNQASPKAVQWQVQDADIATKIRYLHQKGMGLKGIAQKLGLPVAQVKLMLLMQKAQA